MSNGSEVGVLTAQLLREHVIEKYDTLKILVPTTAQTIYYGRPVSNNGRMISHAMMLNQLPDGLIIQPNAVGFAADLMRRYRPPSGITVINAGESLSNSGYVFNNTTMLWVIAELNMMLENFRLGSATFEL